MPNKSKIVLEACVETYMQAVAAEYNGASRIEICDRLDLGGITPPIELVKQLLQKLKIPIMAMVRPRGGDFIYNDQEFSQMVREVETFKKLGCHGVVLGLLTKEGRVDVPRTQQLVELARPLRVTFHKAFDECEELSEALVDLKKIGVDSLLTSGGKTTAIEAVPVLNRLLEETGEKPTLIVAGRVTFENLNDLRKRIPRAIEFHGRRTVRGVLD